MFLWFSVTLEPGPVGHLSFTEILDMSLRVSWQEPVDRNGIITGKMSHTHTHTHTHTLECRSGQIFLSEPDPRPTA